MYVKLNLIAIINQTKPTGISTVYLINKDSKVLLPITVKSLYREGSDNIKVTDPPDIFDTIRRILNSFDSKILGITIYRYSHKRYYSYLNVYKEGKSLEINSELLDSIYLASKYKCPIYIKKEILNNNGLQINKKLIKDALNKDYYLP